MYSVQQLTFDCLSYLREFGSEDKVWHTAAVGDENPAKADFSEHYDVWIHRPALSEKAVNTVVNLLIARFEVQAPEWEVEPGRFVFLGRATQDRTHHREGKENCFGLNAESSVSPSKTQFVRV